MGTLPPYCPNTARLRIIVGWGVTALERSVTQQSLINVGFRSSTQPTNFRIFSFTEQYCLLSYFPLPNSYG